MIDGIDTMFDPEQQAKDIVMGEGDYSEEVDASVEDNLALIGFNHNENLASIISNEDLTALTGYCEGRYEDDKASMSEYHQILADGIKNLGLKIEEFNEPFEGAASFSHPLVVETAIKMQAKILAEVDNGKPIADVRLDPDAEPDVRAQALKVKDYTNYQYLRQFKEFIPETEQLAIRYCLTGNAFRKYYFDPLLNRIKTKFLPEDKMIVNQAVTYLGDADFYTELDTLSSSQYQAMVSSGFFLDEADKGGEDPDQTSNVIEMEISTLSGIDEPSGTTSEDFYPVRYHYVRYQFEDDEAQLPYVVTYSVNSGKVLSIRRNWKENSVDKIPRVWHSHYSFVPGLGFWAWGGIHLLGNTQLALSVMTRCLIDAGQFANIQAGMKDSRVRLTGDSKFPLSPGQMVDVKMDNAPDLKLQDAMKMFDFKEPSQVLERMVGWIDGRIQRFADSTENVVADSTNYGPVGTTVALMDAAAKFSNDIIKRFHRSLKDEFDILHDLNADVLDEEPITIWFKGKRIEISKFDYDGKVEIISSADPSFASQTQRMHKANAKLQAAQLSPAMHDMREVFKDFYMSMGMEEAEINRLMPPKEEAQPLDPMGDVVALTQGKAIRAFEGQDHQSHIEFKTAFLEDPQAGGSPAFGQYVPLLQANMIEHGLLQYKAQLNGINGQAESDMEQAIAAQQLAKLHQLQANTEAFAAGDPTAIIAQTESRKVDLKEKEFAHKKVTDATKFALDAQRIEAQEANAKVKLGLDAIQMDDEQKFKREQLQSDLLQQALAKVGAKSE
jgi:hypothetical protein